MGKRRQNSKISSYMSLVALIISLVYNIINKIPFNINKFALLAGIFQGFIQFIPK